MTHRTISSANEVRLCVTRLFGSYSSVISELVLLLISPIFPSLMFLVNEFPQLPGNPARDSSTSSSCDVAPPWKTVVPSLGTSCLSEVVDAARKTTLPAGILLSYWPFTVRGDVHACVCTTANRKF